MQGLKDFKKCPACGQKNYECKVMITHGWINENGIIKCVDEKTDRVMTEAEIKYWVEQDGFGR